jgi:membrane associated rhomboid family serine protease
MKPRTFEIRGLPAMLLLGVLVIVAIGIVALVLMVGAAVAVAGLALSAGAALYYALRRKLMTPKRPPVWPVDDRPASSSSLEVREIEVEVLPGKER